MIISHYVIYAKMLGIAKFLGLDTKLDTSLFLGISLVLFVLLDIYLITSLVIHWHGNNWTQKISKYTTESRTFLWHFSGVCYRNAGSLILKTHRIILSGNPKISVLKFVASCVYYHQKQLHKLSNTEDLFLLCFSFIVLLWKNYISAWFF